jgi:4-hydroxy-3-methylbut-2-enyl diphosphate reductase
MRDSAKSGQIEAARETQPAMMSSGISLAVARPRLRVLLAGPRGFCAGVDRAIRVVEEALKRWGPPVFVRHEIVHNGFVVEQLEARGAVFVDELDAVPEGAHVVFSAHGVPKSVPREARRRQLAYLDATCPLVSKVHREAERLFAGGGPETRHILMIGHAGHPEVEGTMGQLPPGAMTLVQNAEEARAVAPADPARLAFITQTTLSVEDAAEIIAILRARFPAIEGPRKEDICYATTNRQAAVRAMAGECDLVVVIGSANSSNSQRLREVAERAGRGRAVLIPHARFFRPRGGGDGRNYGRRLGAGSAGGRAAGAAARKLRPRYRRTARYRGERGFSTSRHARRLIHFAAWPSTPRFPTTRCARFWMPTTSGTWWRSAASRRAWRTAISRCAPLRAILS